MLGRGRTEPPGAGGVVSGQRCRAKAGRVAVGQGAVSVTLRVDTRAPGVRLVVMVGLE